MPDPTPRLNGASPGPAAPGPAVPADGAAAVDYAEFVDRQLRWTRGRLRWVELTAGVVLVLAAVGTYLLAMAVLDHWIVPGGLGYLGRTLAWVGLVVLAGALAWWRIGALVWRAIHPLYAAAAIEHAQPELKNSLINFLMLRGERGQLSPAIYQAIEQRAAADVSQVPLERAVDRTSLIRVGYALLVVVALGCAYKLLSPKDPLRSLARVMLPWSTIERPTRVAIFEVEPGTTEVFHGDSLVVSAVIRGLRRGEEARLVYSTADGQVTNRELPLELPRESYRHRVTLPPGGSGLQQDVRYYLVAGDAKTREYQLRVITAPALLVDRVEYAYPTYTGLTPRIVERQGDLVALEGTQVTLWARANLPPRTAHVDFLGDGQNDLAMQVDGLRAKVAFQLRQNPEGQPEYPTYQLRFTTAEGRPGPAPILHRIEVLADQPPQVEFVEPASDPSPLARNGAVSLVIKALDPDFRLEEVGVWLQRDGTTLWSETLLSSAHAGEFRGAVTIDARRLEVEPGQRLECYAFALDGRVPEPNRTEIGPLTIEVIDPVSEAERKAQLAEAAEKEKSPDRPPEERLAQRPPAGERALGEPSARGSAADERPAPPRAPADSAAERAPPTAGEPPPPDEPSSSGNEGERVDPETQPGDAFEKILEHQTEEVPEPAPDQPGSGEGGGQGSSGDQRDRRAGDQDRASGENGNDESSGDAGAEGESAAEPDPAAEPEERGKSGERGGEEGRGQPSPRQEPGDEPGEEPTDGEPGSNAAPGQNLPGGDPNQAGSGDQPRGPGEAGGENTDGEAAESGGEPSGASSAGGAGEGEESATGEAASSSEAGTTGGEPGSDGGAGRDGTEGGEGSEGGDAAGDEESTGPGDADGGSSERGKGPREGARGRGRRTGTGERGAADDAAPSDTPPPEGEAADGEAADGAAPEGEAADAGAGDRPEGEPQASPGERPAGRGSRPQDTPPSAGAGATDNPEATGGDASGAEEEPGSADSETPGEEPESGVGGAEGSRAGGGNPQEGHEGSPAAENQPQSRGPESDAPTQPSEQDAGEPSSPSNQGNRASDSSGSEGGDRSGGGDQGGGQQADAPGAGASGGNSPADSGGGAAPGEGTGPTGTGGGAGAEGTSDDGQGERRQGEGGSGSGGTPRDGAGDSGGGAAPPGSGGGSSDSPAGAAPEAGSSPAAGGGGSTSSRGATGPGGQSNPAGGGLPGDQRGAPEGSLLGSGGAPSGDEAPERQEQETAADQANLDYARRATDLVLEYLKDQVASGDPDQELLDKLGWTPDDMARFLRRWEELKRQAAQEGPAGDEARRRLDRALQGLGLRRRGMQLEAGADQEQTEQIRETRRAGPPPEYREQFRAYTEETADTAAEP